MANIARRTETVSFMTVLVRAEGKSSGVVVVRTGEEWRHFYSSYTYRTSDFSCHLLCQVRDVVTPFPASSCNRLQLMSCSMQSMHGRRSYPSTGRYQRDRGESCRALRTWLGITIYLALAKADFVRPESSFIGYAHVIVTTSWVCCLRQRCKCSWQSFRLQGIPCGASSFHVQELQIMKSLISACG